MSTPPGAATRPVDNRTPVGHVLQQRGQRHDVELADVTRQARRVGHDAAKCAMGELLARARALDESGSKSTPVTVQPRSTQARSGAGAAAHLEHLQR